MEIRALSKLPGYVERFTTSGMASPRQVMRFPRLLINYSFSWYEACPLKDIKDRKVQLSSCTQPARFSHESRESLQT